jgi:hypothetical protein
VQIYTRAYGQSATDPRIDTMLSSVSDPVAMT